MGAPAPQTPVYNAYRVHFLSPSIAKNAGELLKDNKVITDVVDACGGTFFEATACVIAAENLAGLEKKPKRNVLLLCRGSGVPDAAWGEKIQWPDLWQVDDSGMKDEAALAGEWIGAGAGAVAVLSRRLACWESRNGAFGHSHGRLPLSGVKAHPDFFTAGLLHSLMEELLGETLFDKTGSALDRECLEMRPLRLGRGVQSGLAAMAGEGLDSVRSKLGEWRGPVPKSWGGRTR